MNFFELKNITINSFSVYRCIVDKSTLSIMPRDFHSLSYRISGKTEISSNCISWLSEKGAITYVPKGKAYSHNVKQPSEIIAIHFNIAEDIVADVNVLTPQNINEIEKLFYSLIKHWEQNPSSGDINCMLLIYRILSKLNKNNDYNDAYKNHRLLEPAVEYMRTKYSDFNISVSYLANLSGVSEAYFRRQFEQAFGMSPVKYLKKLRIDCAQRLLETGFYSVGEVAFRSGFASTSYFCTQFRINCGVTPHEYTEMARI
ncbi:MAG: hypothetical protein A2Y15_03290 [Clostridiales bacterium GWF2_36_10]|nr:MAG: hypothetical protein A2Y15_03290 [Clostridiales bacterium GWF2_36_10]